MTPQGLDLQSQAFVLGGQLCIWGENVDSANLGTRTWQAGGAVAETLWSGNPDQRAMVGSDAGGLPTEQRLDEWLCHLQGLGIHTGPLLPSFCDVSGTTTIYN